MSKISHCVAGFRQVSAAVILLLVSSIVLHNGVRAQAHLTSHTLTAEDSGDPPTASIEDAAWLTGYWKGEALGGTVEDVWNPVAAQSLVGSFRLVRADTVAFYELVTITEADNSLVMKVKHFDADLTGWEARDEVQSFPLVRRTETGLYFDGLTFERIGSDSLHAYVAAQQGDGEVNELVFRYRRVARLEP